MKLALDDKQVAALEVLWELRQATSKQVAAGVDSTPAQVTKMFTLLEGRGQVMRRQGTKPAVWLSTNWGLAAVREHVATN